MIKLLFVSIISLFMFSCASVEVYQDSKLSSETGFKVYPTAMYLLVEDNPNSGQDVTYFVGPDVSNPQYVKINGGFGSKNISMQLDNGMLVSMGQENYESSRKHEEIVKEKSSTSGNREMSEEIVIKEDADLGIEENSTGDKIPLQGPIILNEPNKESNEYVIEVILNAQERLRNLKYHQGFDIDKSEILSDLHKNLNLIIESKLTDQQVYQSTLAITLRKFDELMSEATASAAKDYNEKVHSIKRMCLTAVANFPKKDERISMYNTSGLAPGLWKMDLSITGKPILSKVE